MGRRLDYSKVPHRHGTKPDEWQKSPDQAWSKQAAWKVAEAFLPRVRQEAKRMKREDFQILVAARMTKIPPAMAMEAADMIWKSVNGVNK